MSDVSSVVNFFSTANEGFVTTLGGSILSGATTVPLTTTSGLTNGSVFVGIIEPGQTKQQVFTGTVDTGGAQITGVVWTRGSNTDHSAGVTIVDYVSGTAHNMATKGILIAHNQTGTHKSGALYPLATISDFTNSTHDHTNAAGGGTVGGAALSTSAIKLGYAEVTTNVDPGTNSETDISGMSQAVTVPAGGRDVKITAKVQVYNSNAGDDFVLRIKEGSTTLDTAKISTSAVNKVVTKQFSARVSAPTAGSHTYKVSIASGAAGTHTEATSTEKCWILVEAI